MKKWKVEGGRWKEKIEEEVREMGGVSVWYRKRMNRRGQSIVEYLIIAALIVAAVIAIAPKLKGTMNNLMASSEAKVFNAELSLASENPEKPAP